MYDLLIRKGAHVQVPPVEATHIQAGVDHRWTLPTTTCIPRILKIARGKMQRHGGHLQQDGWPEDNKVARAVFLPKPEMQANTMSSHSHLTITPNAYRNSAKILCGHLDKWAATWIPEGMYATAPGAEALDANYVVTLRTEFEKMFNFPFAGGPMDMDMCFDNVSPEILLLLATHANFQPQIALTVISYMQILRIVNQYILGLGELGIRCTTILQGCSLSMGLLCPMMSKWCKLVVANNGVPQVLADDLSAFHTGNHSTIDALHTFLISNEFFA